MKIFYVIVLFKFLIIYVNMNFYSVNTTSGVASRGSGVTPPIIHEVVKSSVGPQILRWSVKSLSSK